MEESRKAVDNFPPDTFRNESNVSELHLLLIIFLKIDEADVKKLMNQPPNCKTRRCIESYKLAGSYGKLPSTLKMLSFINSP